MMLDVESQIGSTTAQWSSDGKSFIIVDQNLFEEVTTLVHDLCISNLVATHIDSPFFALLNSTPFQNILAIK